MLVYKTTREVTKKECSWLDEDIPVGTTVYKYLGYTYGCITPGNEAYTMQYNVTPFFELPNDAVELDVTNCEIA